MKKFSLNAVAAAALGFAASGAFATVDIDASPVVPAVFANEIIATQAAPVTLTNAANLLDIKAALGYALSQGEVRYVRVEISNGKFAAAPTVTSSNANAALGLVNGGGTSVLYFSITASAGGLAATDTLTIASNITITGTASSSTVSFSLYDQPSQAQAGGATGRIVDKSALSYINYATSYQVAVTTDSAVSNVEASPTFTAFTTGQTTGLTTKARLASLDYKLATSVPNTAAGAAITLANRMATGAAGTKLVVTGDFAAAANADGTFTGAALNRVFLSANTNCSTVDLAAAEVSAAAASFTVGATATTANPNLCYVPNTTTQIAASSYTAALNAVSATPATYAVVAQDKGTVSTVTRNGTELQAPLYQTTAGYVSRFVLTNTGSVDAPYSVSVKSEAGNTVTPGVTSGTIPANGSVVINAADLATFSAAPRGFAVFTVARPTTQIQGVFQIVNPTSGSVSNTVLVRPGTN